MKITKDTSVIKTLLKQLLRVGKHKWEDKNKVAFYKAKKKLGDITLNNKEADISGTAIEAKVKAILEKIEGAETNKLTATTVAKTPFKDMFRNSNKYNSLEYGLDFFDYLCKSFKEMGIDNVIMEGTRNNAQSIFEGLTLAIGVRPDSGSRVQMPEGYFTRLKNHLFSEYETDYTSKDNFPLNQDVRIFSDLADEKNEDIVVKNMIVGRYYRERNFVHLYFNPFMLNKTDVFTPKGSVVWEDLFQVFTDLKLTKTDTSSMREKLFITQFMQNSRTRLTEVKQQVGSYRNNISSYEDSIRQSITDMKEKVDEIAFIESTLDSKGKDIFKEIDTTRKLPFIESIDIKNATIRMKFKPTCLGLPNFNRSDSTSDNFGKRFVYIGSITFVISPGAFQIEGDAIMNRNEHTHSSGGSACFGSGPGRNKIYETLAANKFCALSKLLWFWIHTHRNSSSYVKQQDAYDNRLMHGYPVFDEKGVRININDKDKLKSKEQQNLDKSSDYDENIERFKGFKLEE